MKFLMASFLGLLISASSQNAQAAEQSLRGGSENIFSNSEESMTLRDFADRLQSAPDDKMENQTYTCRAWTTCRGGGYRIYCWSQGYRCSSSVIPGYRVACSATSASGYTRWWVYYCY